MTWDVCSLNKRWREDQASGPGRRGQQLGGAHSPTEETLTGRAEAPRPGAPEASFSAMTGQAAHCQGGRHAAGRREPERRALALARGSPRHSALPGSGPWPQPRPRGPFRRVLGRTRRFRQSQRGSRGRARRGLDLDAACPPRSHGSKHTHRAAGPSPLHPPGHVGFARPERRGGGDSSWACHRGARPRRAPGWSESPPVSVPLGSGAPPAGARGA